MSEVSEVNWYFNGILCCLRLQSCQTTLLHARGSLGRESLQSSRRQHQPDSFSWITGPTTWEPFLRILQPVTELISILTSVLTLSIIILTNLAKQTNLKQTFLDFNFKFDSVSGGLDPSAVAVVWESVPKTWFARLETECFIWSASPVSCVASSSWLGRNCTWWMTQNLFVRKTTIIDLMVRWLHTVNQTLLKPTPSILWIITL